ncbi:MEDS domain-containing protein [Streptomyces thermocarboxydovorans]|uniref:MEDS domain-containing protein n=1 Tax=Streptomyces thermocarboxydovorans TaxID=59298 RepID=A0ABN1HUB8_9ACTN
MVPNSIPTSVALVPDVQVMPGDHHHLCAFYRGLAARDEILIPYLREGLQAGDKCICVTDATGPEVVLATLSADLDLGPCLSSQQLDVQRSSDMHLRDGRFSTDVMLDFRDDAVGAALPRGFRFSRAVGEMTWSLHQMPGVDDLVGYESRLNRFAPRYPQVLLCLSDLQQFSGPILMDVLRTHPKVLIGGMLIANPYYLEPDEFLATRQRESDE